MLLSYSRPSQMTLFHTGIPKFYKIRIEYRDRDRASVCITNANLCRGEKMMVHISCFETERNNVVDRVKSLQKAERFAGILLQLQPQNHYTPFTSTIHSTASLGPSLWRQRACTNDFTFLRNKCFIASRIKHSICSIVVVVTQCTYTMFRSQGIHD